MKIKTAFSIVALVLAMPQQLWSQATSNKPGLFIYQPASFNSATAKVLVVLHGCLQDASAMSLGTGFNDLAEQENLLVIYAQGPRNPAAFDCWPWYEPQNQTDASGLAFELHQLIQNEKLQRSLTHAETWIAGLSSGGAMVSNLIACFPNSFQAAAVVMGVSYGVASDPLEAWTSLAKGTFATPKATPQRACEPRNYGGHLMVVSDINDKVVHLNNLNRILDDFLPARTPTNPQSHSEKGVSFEKIEFVSNGKRRGSSVQFDGPGHFWLGTNQNPLIELPYFQKKGPSFSKLILDEFKSK